MKAQLSKLVIGADHHRSAMAVWAGMSDNADDSDQSPANRFIAQDSISVKAAQAAGATHDPDLVAA